MGGGSAAPCFAEARGEVNGAGMVLGVQNVQNARGRHGCVEHMVAPQASVQVALGQCASRTKHGWG